MNYCWWTPQIADTILIFGQVYLQDCSRQDYKTSGSREIMGCKHGSQDLIFLDNKFNNTIQHPGGKKIRK
jgi:hypothetical protein